MHIRYLSDNIHGFRPKRISALDCSTQLIFDIYQSSIHKQFLTAIFLDIRSAYNQVNAHTLYKLLRRINVPIHWSNFIFKLFLQHHIHILTADRYTLSILRTINHNLPQDAPLSSSDRIYKRRQWFLLCGRCCFIL